MLGKIIQFTKQRKHVCDKKNYISRSVAKKKMKLLNKKNILDKKIKDVYFCNVCRSWHLTSMNKKKARNFRNYLMKRDRSE